MATVGSGIDIEWLRKHLREPIESDLLDVADYRGWCRVLLQEIDDLEEVIDEIQEYM